MPLVHSRLSQNMQFTWVTHLFLKFALDVDIVVSATTDEHSLFQPTNGLYEEGGKNKKVVAVVRPLLAKLRLVDPTAR